MVGWAPLSGNTERQCSAYEAWNYKRDWQDSKAAVCSQSLMARKHNIQTVTTLKKKEVLHAKPDI